MGFPDKFHRWRTNQEECVERSLCNRKRVTANCAPTGFGKTQVFITEALMSGRTCIVTSMKGHMDQMMKDYGDMGLVQIRGKDNYECSSRPGWTCKDGHVGGCSLKATPNCPYTEAYQVARTSKLLVTNYKFWIAIHKYGFGLGNFDLVIFDEADECPDELADSMQVKLSHHEMEEMVGVGFPTKDPDALAWKSWAATARQVATKLMNEKKVQIDSSRNVKPTWIRDFHHFKNIIQKLGTVCTMRIGDWVWEEQDWGFQFDPIKFARYRESRLFLNAKKVSMYSATIRPKTLWMLGIGNDDMEFHEYPSIFPPERSPVYYIPTMRVDSHNHDIRALSMKIDQIIRPRLEDNRNGIVHVSSFDYRNRITRGSRFGPFFLSHWDNSPVAEAVERFKLNGGVLISPSIAAGYNFPGDECRFQIITKIPFKPRSKVTDARQALDKHYGAYQAMRPLVQAAGRGNRSEDDWCETMILDDHWQWFFKAYEWMAPKSFWERYKWSNTIPRMLQA